MDKSNADNERFRVIYINNPNTKLAQTFYDQFLRFHYDSKIILFLGFTNFYALLQYIPNEK